MKRIPLFLLLITLPSIGAVEPSLKDDCHFEAFQGTRLSTEVSRFWERTVNTETHDLRAERAYVSALKTQILECYQNAVAKDLKDCDLRSYRFDKTKTQAYVDLGEYTPWVVSSPVPYAYYLVAKKDAEEEIYPAKMRYLDELAAALTACFEEKHLKLVDKTAFNALYGVVRVLRDARDRLKKNKALMLDNAVSTSTRGYGKDSETTYRISLNDWILEMDDENGIRWYARQKK